MSSNSKEVFGDYRVDVYDGEGTVIQSIEVEDTGAVEIEDVYGNALVHQIERIEIVPLEVRLVENGEVVLRIESEDEEPLKTEK